MPKALVTSQAKAEDARAELRGTALASASDGLDAARLARMAADDSDEPTDFRSGVLAAMTEALGRVPVTRQDAINATYRKVGWKEGSAPTDRQNRDAYHQACRWGFTLGQLTHAGRAGAFGREQLAPEALDEHAHRAFTKGYSPERAAERSREFLRRQLSEARATDKSPTEVKYRPMAAAKSTSDEVQDGDEEVGTDARAERIANLSMRIDQLAQTTRDLNQQLQQLEQEAAAKGVGAGRLRTLNRRAESVRELIRFAEAGAEKLERSLESARNQE